MSILSSIFGDGGDGGVGGSMQAAKDTYDRLIVPELQWKDYNPEALQSIDAQYKLIDENPQDRAMQMQALSRLSGLAENGLSDVDQGAYFKAQQMGNQMAKSGRDAAIQDAAARGMGGSGMEFALREMANQQGAQRAQEAALQQAADSAKQRALYNQAFADQAGQLRQQDYAANAANTNIINQFNQANTQAQNQANQMNVQNRNQAQQYNLEGARGVQQQNYDNQLKKAQGISGAYQGIANSQAANQAAERADRNTLISLGGQVGAAYAGKK